jgi:AcrR family transcriptional regulator
MSPRTHTQWEEIRGKSREKILNAAISLFSSIGYFSTSVSKIAQKAGVSKGLLYNYFDSKDQLLVAIVNKTIKLLDNAFTVSGEISSPKEELILLIENMYKIIENHQGFLRMLIPLSMQMREFDFINSMINKKYKESVLRFLHLFEKLNYKNPEDEARILIATLDGIMYQYLVLGDNLPYEKIKIALINKYNNKK